MSNIDEKAKNNFTIEMRIFENYEKVKHEIIKVIDFLRHAETNMGMCRIFDNQNHEFWHSVIKPWFQPERFNITHLWFLCVLCLGMPLTCVFKAFLGNALNTRR
jgi:hypothetical protein